MFRTKSILAALLIVVVSGSAASAQQKGDWVLGNYQGSGYWFAGVVDGVRGDKVTVQYDDGDRETLNRGNVKPYNWKVGTRVQCNFKGLGDWYDGKIAALSGANISINYDDGDKEKTTTGMCRSQ